MNKSFTQSAVEEFRKKYGIAYLHVLKNPVDTSHISYELTDENMPLMFREMEGWLSSKLDQAFLEGQAYKGKLKREWYQKGYKEGKQEIIDRLIEIREQHTFAEMIDYDGFADYALNLIDEVKQLDLSKEGSTTE